MTTKTQNKIRKLFADRETREVFSPCGSPEKARVDPTYAEDSQIKNMLLKFARGEIQPRQPIYADVADFGDFREMQQQVIKIRSEFDKLPASIRNLAQNDPSQLVQIAQDPKYKDFLTQEGFFKQLSKNKSDGSPEPLDAELEVHPRKTEPKGEVK